MDKASADTLVGRTVAHYEIMARLGGGGMGIVYAARDTRLGRRVALKFLPPQWSHDDSAKERFIREAQAASATDHPNICTIHDIGTAGDGQLFIVMAHYEGATLKQRLESGPLAVEEAVDIAAQVAEGLAKAHAQGIIHRDIKPGNLMLTEDGVKILDFGLAKFADSAVKLTLEGTTIGTIGYMSPEQVRGDNADARSDVWGLGAVLYEMLARQVPFKGGYPEAIAHAIKHEAPAPLRGSRPEVSDALEQIVFRALHKDPAVRFQTARDMARALRGLQGRSLPLDLRTEPLPRVDPVPAPPRARLRTRRAAAAVSAIAALLLGAPLWLLVPVERIPVAVAPVANQTGYAELDPYRMALTQALTEALADSRSVRPLPYDRLLQITRRFRVPGQDVSSRAALQALAAHAGARFLIVPTLVYEDGRWHSRVEIRRPDTATNVAEYTTPPVTSSLIKDTSYGFVPTLAASIDDHFTTTGPVRGAVAQRLRAWFAFVSPAALSARTLDAAAALERALDAYDRQEYGLARAALDEARQLDARSVTIETWRSRVAALLRRDNEAADAGAAALRLLTDDTPPVVRWFAEAVDAEARRDFPTADARYRELAEAVTDEPRWLMELAAYQDRRGAAAEAAVTYLDALAVDGALPRAHLELCRLYGPNRLNEIANAREHGQRAVDAYRRIGDRAGEAQALMCLADFLRAGDAQAREEARRHADAAVTLLETTDGPYQLARAYYYVALVAGVEGRFAESVAVGQRALAAARTAGNAVLEPLILMNLGVAANLLGRPADAIDYYHQTSTLFEALGDQQRAAQTQANAAAVAIDFGGDQGAALRDIENALAVFRQIGDRDFEIFALEVLGKYYRNTGRYADAEREVTRGIAIARERNLEDKVSLLSVEVAITRLEQGDYVAAERLLTPIVEQTGGAHATRARIQRARARLRLGDFMQAEADLMTAAADAEQRADRPLLATLYLVRGELAHESARPDEARSAFARSAALWQDDRPDSSSVEARAYVGLGQALAGDVAAGRAAAEASLARAQKVGRRALEAQVRILLARIEIAGRRFAGAQQILDAIPTGPEPPRLNPELETQARYWRGEALAALGDRAGAAREKAAARAGLETHRQALPAAYRETFAARTEVRPLLR